MMFMISSSIDQAKQKNTLWNLDSKQSFLSHHSKQKSHGFLSFRKKSLISLPFFQDFSPDPPRYAAKSPRSLGASLAVAPSSPHDFQPPRKDEEKAPPLPHAGRGGFGQDSVSKVLPSLPRRKHWLLTWYA